MIGSEERTNTAEEKKARIRERYKGIDPNELDVIPAIKTADFYNDKSTKYKDPNKKDKKKKQP